MIGKISNEELLQKINRLERDIQQIRNGTIIKHISEAIHWKDTPKVLTGGTDYTVDGVWTDLSLKVWTSDKAKIVLLRLEHNDTCSVDDIIDVRKNGTTTLYPGHLYANVVGKAHQSFVPCPMDSSQKVEYYATDASDTKIIVLGYIE